MTQTPPSALRPAAPLAIRDLFARLTREIGATGLAAAAALVKRPDGTIDMTRPTIVPLQGDNIAA